MPEWNESIRISHRDSGISENITASFGLPLFMLCFCGCAFPPFTACLPPMTPSGCGFGLWWCGWKRFATAQGPAKQSVCFCLGLNHRPHRRVKREIPSCKSVPCQKLTKFDKQKPWAKKDFFLSLANTAFPSRQQSLNNWS